MKITRTFLSGLGVPAYVLDTFAGSIETAPSFDERYFKQHLIGLKGFDAATALVLALKLYVFNRKAKPFVYVSAPLIASYDHAGILLLDNIDDLYDDYKIEMCRKALQYNLQHNGITVIPYANQFRLDSVINETSNLHTVIFAGGV